MAAWERARAEFATDLLEQTHELYAGRTTKRVVRILSLRYDKRTLDLVRDGLGRPSRRGNALELLDGVLEAGLRPRVMPWFDDTPVAERVARAGALVGDVPAPLAYIREGCAHANPYFVAVFLDALARHPRAEARALVEERLESPDSIVREQALVTLAAIDREAAERAAARLAADPSEVVRARAASMKKSSDPGETVMRTTLEKVLLLKTAAVFSKVDAEDLAPMAHAATEHEYEPGETIVAEGEVGDVLYLIVSGHVVVKRAGVELASLGPGETFGEMAVLDAEPRSATVIASEPTRVLAIASEDFYDVLHEQAEIAEGVIRVLTHRLRAADRAVDPVSMLPPPPKE
jgi:hypothetical protein